jgi:hypothetical protein
MEIFTIGLRGAVSLVSIPSKPTDTRLLAPESTQYGTMDTSTPLPTSTFRNLPTELVLIICSHLPSYDLFFHVRPTSRLLRTCAQEILLKQIFQQTQISFSWCCFWCTLGDLSLNAVTKDVTRLFSTRANVHVDGVSEKALVAKLALGDVCNSFYGQQRVRVSIGEGDAVTVKAAALPDCRYSTSPQREEQRWAFSVFFFARLGKEKNRWCAITGLVSAARILGVLVVGAWLLVVVSGCLVIFFVGMEIYKLIADLYDLCSRGLEAFTGYVNARWKVWSDRIRARERADLGLPEKTEGASDGDNYEDLPQLWLS